MDGFGLDNIFRVGDARASGPAAGSFGGVAADLFEHPYPDDSEAVAVEAFRPLRPRGRIAVRTPWRSHLLEVLENNDIIPKRDISQVDCKSIPLMREILERAGFEIVRVAHIDRSRDLPPTAAEEYAGADARAAGRFPASGAPARSRGGVWRPSTLLPFPLRNSTHTRP